VIPVLIDGTPLPTLVAEYRGFQLRTLADLTSIAQEIAGDRDEADSARRLQKRLLELALGEFPADDPITAGFCPRCASTQLAARIVDNSTFDNYYYQITCGACDLVHRVRLRKA
jgi:RNase P subunit RPR2